MIVGRTVASALAAAAVALTSSPRATTAFSTQPSRSYANLHRGHHLRATVAEGVDTDAVLPAFDTKEDYVSYLKAAGKLPAGFAVGTATGEFVSVEAPAMGKLPIKATVIHLTEGPTDSWAAVFTSNKVRQCLQLHLASCTS